MSAALQLPMIRAVSHSQRAPQKDEGDWERRPAAQPEGKPQAEATGPVVSLAFYRTHTEKMLRRYLHASMQVGRTPNILSEPIARGWASSRPVRTFEDAVIFVLDIETCLNALGSLDRQMLCRIVIQEYTQTETATLLGMSARTMSYKFPQALDRLTEKLLDAGLLVLPN
jgi:DNA-directed RNA polymerase specialized sigma24 family protein